MKRVLMGAVWGVALSALAVVAVLYFADLRVTHQPSGSASDEGSGLFARFQNAHEQQPISVQHALTSGTVEVSDVVGKPLSEALPAIGFTRLRPHVVGLGQRVSIREKRHVRVARQVPAGGRVVPGGSTVKLYVKGT